MSQAAVLDMVQDSSDSRSVVLDTLQNGNNPTQLFQGFNSFQAKVAPSNLVTGQQSSPQSSTTLGYRICKGSSEVSQFLDVSVDASASGSLGSVTGKANYIKGLNLSETSVTIAVYVTNSLQVSASQVQYPEGWTPPTGKNPLKTFFATNGDSYVDSYTYGSELIATYVFEAQDEDEQTTIIGSLKASGISPVGNLTADFQGNVKNAVKSISTSCIFKSYIRGVANAPSVLDENAWVTYALSIPTLPFANPVTLS